MNLEKIYLRRNKKGQCVQGSAELRWKRAYILMGPAYILVRPAYILMGPAYILMGPAYFLMGPAFLWGALRSAYCSRQKTVLATQLFVAPLRMA
jgi:hypothetical protein